MNAFQQTPPPVWSGFDRKTVLPCLMSSIGKPDCPPPPPEVFPATLWLKMPIIRIQFCLFWLNLDIDPARSVKEYFGQFRQHMRYDFDDLTDQTCYNLRNRLIAHHKKINGSKH